MSTEMIKPETLIFVYGTLKRDFPNHHILSTLTTTSDATFIGVYKTLEPFPLVIGPLGVPFLINHPGTGHQVKGELYSVSGTGLARLDLLEGVSRGHYERLPVTVVGMEGEEEGRDVEAYFADSGFGDEMWVKSGGGMEEYGLSDAEEYVGVEARDVGFSLRDYVRIWLQNK